MLDHMREIEQIRTFEDRLFQRRILHWSAAVLAGGVLAGIAWYAGIEALNVALGLDMEPFEFGRVGSFWMWAASLVLLSAVALVAHELVHGFFFKQFAPPGARVSYGVNWSKGMAYACAEGTVYTRRHYRAIILAPTVIVSGALLAIGIGLKWPLWSIAAVTVHLSGCTGDWAYLAALRANPDILWCEDTSWGVRFYGADAPAAADPSADGAAPAPGQAAAGEAFAGPVLAPEAAGVPVDGTDAHGSGPAAGGAGASKPTFLLVEGGAGAKDATAGAAGEVAAGGEAATVEPAGAEGPGAGAACSPQAFAPNAQEPPSAPEDPVAGER